MSIKRITFFVPTMHGGGAERVVINLLRGMSQKNITLDLVVATLEGPNLNQIPPTVRVIDLGTKRVLTTVFPLAQYLQQNQPAALISHMGHANVVAVAATKLARHQTKLILVEHNTLSAAKSKFLRARLMPTFMKVLYPSADYVVGVSQAVARDLESELSLPQQTVKTIYNPIVDQELLAKANLTISHPWLQPDTPPIFLAVGRLTKQKDFLTLIKAFALVRQQAEARLMILGEGECRVELETAIARLNLTEDVTLPGFVDNPYAYMRQVHALVLSSRWEGLPSVLIEAMACGCPVIATDCPSGPKEILAEGKYGHLVSVGNPEQLSIAMLKILKTSVKKELLMQRAMYFSVDRAAVKYLKLIN